MTNLSGSFTRKKQEKDNMDIGIDFGSTYSLITTFDGDNLKELKPDGDTAVTPSYLSIDIEDDSNVKFGTFSKSKVHSKNFRHFSGFKMMLVEKDAETLKNNGYIGKYTPRYVTEKFLKEMLNGILIKEKPAGSQIDISSDYKNVYICVPELWARHAKTMDGCYALREILDKKLGIKNVTIVMEPEAASAYFAYIYHKNTKEPFNGYLFLIDFGGGTLDITLAKVASDGQGTIIIKRVNSDGLGENHVDTHQKTELGNAGMAYIQRLVLNVLSNNGVKTVNIISPAFRETIVELENTLMSPQGITKIREKFSRFGSYQKFKKIFDDKYTDISAPENIFTKIDFNDDRYPVRYSDLYEAYKQVVEEGLSKTIGKMCDISRQYIHKDPCTIEAGEARDFKIALVGGFGSFYFVQKQIEQIFNIQDMNEDCRTKGLTVSENEKAVSYGAALLAAGRVKLKKTASYSLGLQVRDRVDPNIRRLMYAIKFNQEIVNDEICYITDESNRKAKFMSITNSGNRSGVIHRIISGDDFDIKKGYPMMMKNEYMDTLSTLPKTGTWYIGFSIDENYLITLHVVSTNEEIDLRYPLDNYDMMFDMQTVDYVHDGEFITDGTF